jgi:hypothetical protein
VRGPLRAGRHGSATTTSVAAAALSLLLLTVGCGSSAGTAPDAKLKAVVSQGIAEIQTSHDAEQLRTRLLRTRVRLRALRGASAAGRRARVLASKGFGRMLCGVESRLSFANNDSGNVEAATRDAIRADRCFGTGAALLRAAARTLGFRAGRLNGY